MEDIFVGRRGGLIIKGTLFIANEHEKRPSLLLAICADYPIDRAFITNGKGFMADTYIPGIGSAPLCAASAKAVEPPAATLLMIYCAYATY